MVIKMLNALIQLVNRLGYHKNKQLLLEACGLTEELICYLDAPLRLFGPINLILTFTFASFEKVTTI